ncbi:5-formyltetrahydrofolate cyclo-ligase isoform X3 [Manis pentadactyla]|nr:5-formyltetrahydrofolate cyclo-ligase isoform X3 [Manis pentadactyla]
MQDEVETEEIIKDIFRQGKTCFIPRYQFQSNHMDMVKLASAAEISSLPKTSWNIAQPGEDEVREEALSTAHPWQMPDPDAFRIPSPFLGPPVSSSRPSQPDPRRLPSWLSSGGSSAYLGTTPWDPCGQHLLQPSARSGGPGGAAATSLGLASCLHLPTSWVQRRHSSFRGTPS